MNKPCQQLDDFFDGQLNESQTQKFEEHLEDCLDCRESVQDYRLIDVRLCEAWESVRLPNVLKDASDLEAKSKRGVPQRHWNGKLLAASLLLIAGVVLLIAFMTPQGFSPEVVESDRRPSLDEGVGTKKQITNTVPEQTTQVGEQPPVAFYSLASGVNETQTDAIFTANSEPEFTIVNVYSVISANTQSHEIPSQ